jgi:hypothetical protein
LIPLSLRLSRINFDILAQDKHIKPSLTQLMDQILEKLVLAHIKRGREARLRETKLIFEKFGK